ncbi:MAG: four helix bundle protein, partial [Ruminococcaceae bacterium]|nr:four helix bundle protein [Oscillospiraceae bacterium]
MKENILIDKSIDFAARIIKLQRYLVKDKKETIISKQIVRSGTSIGANINEANYGQSKADFISKLHISLKETAETEYWLRLL